MPSTLTRSDLESTSARVHGIAAQARRGRLPRDLTLEPGNALPTVTHTLLDRRAVVRSTVTPAVLSLVLVALILLSRLLSATMNLRRGESRAGVPPRVPTPPAWLLGMTEPLLILHRRSPALASLSGTSRLARSPASG